MYPKTMEPWPLGDSPANALCGEDERLSVLASYGAQDLSDDPELARIVGFTARLCNAPAALITLVEQENLRFLAKTGTDLDGTPRSISFCPHAMLSREPMVVCDAAADSRFADNPLVTGEPHIRFYAGAPLVSEEGAPLGALCVIDGEARPEGLNEFQTEGLAVLANAVMRRLRHQRENISSSGELAEREQRLRSIVDSVPGIAWSADSRANFDYFSARWREVTGEDPPKVAADWKRFVHPDDFERTWENFSNALQKLGPFEGEFRLLQADGSWRWVLSRAIPMGEDLRKARWFGTMIDVDESHRLAESRDLLANELSHRIKNIFAVVAGLIAIRSRGKAEVAVFASEVTAAIMALGTAHEYVRPVEGRTSDKLLGLLEDLLAPYGKREDGRVIISGDDISIGAHAATPLALIFHELATNSAKYGALSCEDGKISIEVTAPCKDDETVCVLWRESGCEASTPGDTAEEGFGSRMLRMAIEGQLGGQFSRSFTTDGLDIELIIPSERITG